MSAHDQVPTFLVVDIFPTLFGPFATVLVSGGKAELGKGDVGDVPARRFRRNAIVRQRGNPGGACLHIRGHS